MNKRIGLQLIVFGVALSGLSGLVHHLAPGGNQPTLIAGLAGGALCLVWGARALAGSGGKALPLLTLIPVSIVLLPQVFMNWTAEGQGLNSGPTVAVLITLLLAMSLAMLVRIAWSGVVFDVPPANAKKAG